MTRIEQSVEVNVPATAVYNQLTQFEEYPRFMEDIQEVRQLDDTHLHWRARLNSHDEEWDAEILEQVPDRLIAWRNEGGPIRTEKVEVQSLDQEKSKVTVTMEYEARQQQAEEGDIDVKIAQHAINDLMRFKKFIEGRGQETGGWRGQVQQGQEVGQQGARERQEARSEKAGGQISDLQKQAVQATQDAVSAGMASMNPQSWLPNILHAWEEPFVMMRKMTEDMDQIFERSLGRPMYGSKSSQGAKHSSGTWSPPLEVSQRENQVVVRAELPGIEQDSVRVEIKNDRLVIEGDRREEQRQEGQGYYRSERSYGHFYRAISLPEGVDADQASASMRNGLLEVVVPVQQSTQQRGRKLDIRS